MSQLLQYAQLSQVLVETGSECGGAAYASCPDYTRWAILVGNPFSTRPSERTIHTLNRCNNMFYVFFEAEDIAGFFLSSAVIVKPPCVYATKFSPLLLLLNDLLWSRHYFSFLQFIFLGFFFLIKTFPAE